MLLHINGENHTTYAATLDELIRELELDPDALVVEHNEQIVRQEFWADTRLQEQDQVELLSFVGGG